MNATAKALLSMALKEARKQLKKPIVCDTWRLEGTVALDKRGRDLWHATLDPVDPLRLRHLPTGRCLCPPWREFDTDLASVPSLLQKALRRSKTLHLRRDAFPRAAAFHDAIYAAHWCWTVDGGLALVAPVTRAEADAILYLCLASEGATVADGLAWHAAVRAAGARHWRLDPDAPAWPPLFAPPSAEPRTVSNLLAESPAVPSVAAGPSGDSAPCQSPAGASPCAPPPNDPQPQKGTP